MASLPRFFVSRCVRSNDTVAVWIEAGNRIEVVARDPDAVLVRTPGHATELRARDGVLITFAPGKTVLLMPHNVSDN